MFAQQTEWKSINDQRSCCNVCTCSHSFIYPPRLAGLTFGDFQRSMKLSVDMWHLDLATKLSMKLSVDVWQFDLEIWLSMKISVAWIKKILTFCVSKSLWTHTFWKLVYNSLSKFQKIWIYRSFETRNVKKILIHVKKCSHILTV